jgi:DNA modification methylase
VTVQILTGDCREVLKTMPDESVHCVVTSPPYFGLRDYGTAKWEGGDAGCDHSPEKRGGRFAAPVSDKQRSNTGSGSASVRDCPCGATRIDSQLGLEPTPDEFVAAMVAVFREVRRVLRGDGTLWLNLGDSYAANRSYQVTDNKHKDVGNNGAMSVPSGLKPKDLVGIPWRVAFALQADGWWLRQDIIWAKPNPMPESIRDRCTKSHEYLFLLSKSAKYYYDADAIAEAATFPDGPNAPDKIASPYGQGFTRTAKAGNKSRTSGAARGVPGAPTDGGTNGAVASGVPWEGSTRNKRSVWTVTTQPFGEAHFATFPPALIEPCILAGCPVDGTVLDPFGGAGTTGLVADRHHRNAILIELNPEYSAMAEKRIRGESPLFAQVTA